MAFKGAKGQIRFLRVNDLGNVYGPPSDAMHTEVVIGLDNNPNLAVGMELRDGDPNLPSRLAMLSVLRDAYIHKLTIGIAFDIAEGKQNGILRRVELSR